MQATDSKGINAIRDRLLICQLALFQLPEEALSDIREEIEYKIQYYQELADYDALHGTPIKPPSVRARVKEATTRPVFYLPLIDD